MKKAIRMIKAMRESEREEMYAEYLKNPPITPKWNRKISSSFQRAFWNGFDGSNVKYEKTTFAHACFRAGRDYKIIKGGW